MQYKREEFHAWCAVWIKLFLYYTDIHAYARKNSHVNNRIPTNIVKSNYDFRNNTENEDCHQSSWSLHHHLRHSLRPSDTYMHL